jgi:hypothetical protein
MPTNEHVYKIDRFHVPEHAYVEFLSRVRSIHEYLRTLPGFLEDRLLTQQTADASRHLLTLVVWEDEQALRSARQQVEALYTREQFDPKELMSRLGVVPEIGLYRPVGQIAALLG